jgi:hypothetical protein
MLFSGRHTISAVSASGDGLGMARRYLPERVFSVARGLWVGVEAAAGSAGPYVRTK